jgi:hypothetical protein
MTMQIQNQTVELRPLLVREFNTLRDLYDEYLTSAIVGSEEEVVAACTDLLTFALSRSKHSIDPNTFPDLDSNELKEIVSLAAGDLKNSLEVHQEMIETNISKFMSIAVKMPGVEKEIENGLSQSLLSPKPSAPQSPTSKTST